MHETKLLSILKFQHLNWWTITLKVLHLQAPSVNYYRVKSTVVKCILFYCLQEESLYCEEGVPWFARWWHLCMCKTSASKRRGWRQIMRCVGWSCTGHLSCCYHEHSCTQKCFVLYIVSCISNVCNIWQLVNVKCLLIIVWNCRWHVIEQRRTVWELLLWQTSSTGTDIKKIDIKYFLSFQVLINI